MHGNVTVYARPYQPFNIIAVDNSGKGHREKYNIIILYCFGPGETDGFSFLDRRPATRWKRLYDTRRTSVNILLCIYLYFYYIVSVTEKLVEK